MPIVKFLQGCSVAEGATQILEQLTAEAAVPPMPVVGSNDFELEALDQLSDEQVDSMLTELLTVEEANE